MNESAIKAFFIVALSSFLVGIVIAYQSANQLSLYGANIFIVDMIGLSMLRELLPVITAVIIAGRSGSLVQLENIKSKFTILRPIIDEVGINDKISQYYSKWLEQSKVMQLTRRQITEQQFLLLSFTKYQYYIRNDNLIDRFISIIQTTKNSLFRHQKELSFKYEPLKKALTQSLEDSNLSIINDVNAILEDNTMNDSKKVSQLKEIMATKTQNLKTLMIQRNDIEEEDLNRFDFIEQASKSLQGKLSGVVKLIQFDEKSSNKNLMHAIKYFKDTNTIKQDAPLEFLDEFDQLPKSLEEETEKYTKIKHFSKISASAGGGSFNYNDNYEYLTIDKKLLDSLYKSSNSNPDSIIALNITGDSMEPTLLDREVVLWAQTYKWVFFPMRFKTSLNYC